MLAACGGSEATYPERDEGGDVEALGGGTIFENFGGLSLGGSSNETGATGGLAVNADLWRATLDTLSFLPLAATDPAGGAILTDWHSETVRPDERFKINAVISSAELRADALRVSVFREIREGSGWSPAPVAAQTARQIETIILTRARALRQAR